MEKVFCIHCDKENEFYTKEVIKDVIVKEVSCKVKVTECYCRNCGKSVFVYSVEKENQKIVFDTYKKKMGLLTSDEIISIRKKYGLTQKGLAKVICCGEKNIARYENGAIQDNCINLLLKTVDAHPEIFGLKSVNKAKVAFVVSDFITTYKESDAVKYQEPKISNNFSVQGGKTLKCVA